MNNSTTHSVTSALQKRGLVKALFLFVLLITVGLNNSTAQDCIGFDILTTPSVVNENCIDGSIEVVVQNGTPPYTVSFYHIDQDFQLNLPNQFFGDTIVLDFLSLGSYEVTVTDSEECTITSDPLVVGGECLVDLTGLAFMDSNDNGLPDMGEEPVEGLIVVLNDDNDDTVGVFPTDENGQFTFSQAPGSYTVLVPETLDDGSQFSGNPAVPLQLNAGPPVYDFYLPYVPYVLQAVNDTVYIGPQDTVSIAVIENDLGSNLIIDFWVQPEFGSIELVPTGVEIEYTASEGFIGEDAFTYTVIDNLGGMSTGTVVVFVLEGPLAADDSYVTEAGVDILMEPMLNDQGIGITISTLNQPIAGGTVIWADIEDNQLIFTVDEGFSGTTQFSYVIVDAAGNTSEATVTIEVGEGPTIQAVLDFAETGMGMPVQIDVLANDIGEGLSIQSIAQPVDSGSVAFNADSTALIFTPADGFEGTATFEYVIEDENGEVSLGGVSVLVGNISILGMDDEYQINVGDNVIMSVLENDLGEGLVIAGFLPPAEGGTLTQLNNGQLLLEPTEGFIGVITFSYSIINADGDIDSAEVTVTIVDAAIDAEDDEITVQGGTIATINVLDNDTGVGLAITNFTQPSDGTVSDSGDGQSLVYDPGPSFIGTTSFMYTIVDEDGNNSTATVLIDVVAPELTLQDDESLTSAGETVQIPVLLNDFGQGLTITGFAQPVNGGMVVFGSEDGVLVFMADEGFVGNAVFSYDVQDQFGSVATANVVVTVTDEGGLLAVDDDEILQSGANGVFDVLANDFGDSPIVSDFTQPVSGGTVAFGPGTSLLFIPEDGFAGVVTFTYTITDSSGEFSTATVTVNVTINLAIEAVNDVVSTDPGTPIVIDVLENDTGDGLVILTFGQPSIGGTVVEDPNGGGLLFTPFEGFIGSVNFGYSITDGLGNVDDGLVTVNVENTGNQPPCEDSLFFCTGVLQPFDMCFENCDPDGDSIYIESAVSTFNCSVDIFNDTCLTYGPLPGFQGVDSVLVVICDNQLPPNCSTTFVTVGVGECEDPVANDDFYITAFGTPVVVEFFLNDSGTGITLLDFEQPTGATVTVSGDDFIVTPDPGFSGDIFFDYVITDIFGTTDEATVFVTVQPSFGPIALNDEATTDQDVGISIPVLENDEGSGLSITNVNQPAEGGSVEIAGEEIVFTPAPGFSGIVSFEYEITDDAGLTANATVIVEVLSSCGNITELCTAPAVPQQLCFSFCDIDEPVSIVDASTLYTCSITYDSDTCITYIALPGAEGLAENLQIVGCTADEAICDTLNVAIIVTCTDPVAQNDNATTEPATEVQIDVLANDENPCNNVEDLEVTVTNEPANGQIVAQDNGLLTYLPNPGFSGTDTFTYEACNDCSTAISDGLCDDAIVSVTVSDNPTELTANPDSYTTEFEESINLPVLSNDIGEGINITDNTQPENGTLVLEGVEFVYTPNPDFEGTDSFTYTITDANGETAEATVTIVVNGPAENQPPVANSDMVSTEGQFVAIEVLDNDTDPEDGVLIITEYTTPDVGTLELSADSTFFIYTPEPGFEGLVTYQYTVCDDGEPVLCDSAIVEVAVGVPPSNNPPIAVNDTTATQEGGALVIDVLLNDSDPDGDNFSITDVVEPANGTIVVDAENGTITYTPDPLFSGQDTFVYTICDDADVPLCSDAVVVVEVEAIEPPIGFDVEADIVYTSIDTPVEVFVLINDTGEGLFISEFSQGEFGSVLASGNDGALIYNPAPGFTGQDYFFYTACDEEGDCQETIVAVTVYPAGEPNHAPVANDDLYEVDPGASASLDVLLNDQDPENTPLTITEVSEPTFGTVTINAEGTGLDYVTAPGFTGTDTFTYTICDEGTPQECSTATVTVVVGVELPNTPPNAVDDFQTVDQNVVVTIVVTVNDTDAETASQDLDVTLLTQPLFGTAGITPGSNEVTYMPDFNFVGTDYFLYVACDDGTPVLCDTAYVVIQVGEVVEPNEDFILQPDVAYTNLTAQVEIDVLANDSGEDLVITNFSNPSHGTVIFGENPGDLVYIPNGSFVGTDYFIYTACQPDGSCESTLVAVVVLDQGTNNVPPIAVNDTYMTEMDQSINFDVMENDSDPFGGANISICDVSSPPNGSLIQEADGTFTYFPNDGFIGEDSFSYTICDDGVPPLNSTAVVTITVGTGGLSNQFPIATDDFMSGQTNVPISIPVLENDMDPDGDGLTLILLTPPGNGNAEVSEGQIVYTSDLGFIGTDYLMYQICDDGTPALYDTAFVTIEVIANQTPEVIANDDAATSIENVPVTVPVLGNDSWPLDSALVVTIFSDPISGGIVTVNGDNTIQYTPPLDFVGEDSFQYILCAGLLCDTATVIMTVLPEDEPPVECEIEIQGGFSPNDDGINDGFQIEALDCYQEQNPELIIFNRWGSEVYRKQPMAGTDVWDGTWDVNGEQLPDGTYYYILILNENDSGESLQGFVELRRQIFVNSR